MPAEFVLSVSSAKKSFQIDVGQCLDSAMSTICHIAACAVQRELDFCSRALAIVLGICLAIARLLSKAMMYSVQDYRIWRDI
jgi:hypothetical protein